MDGDTDARIYYSILEAVPSGDLGDLSRLMNNLNLATQVADLCKERMHILLAEELGRAETEEAWMRAAVGRSFARMDELALTACACGKVGMSPCGCERSGIESEIVGSTAAVAIVGGSRIFVANCGDSRTVLSRGGRAVPLSSDHKVSPVAFLAIITGVQRAIASSATTCRHVVFVRTWGDGILVNSIRYDTCHPNRYVVDGTRAVTGFGKR